MKVNIYLKSKKRPVKFDLTKSEYEQLIHLLQTRDIIVLGSLVFSRDNLSHVIVE